MLGNRHLEGPRVKDDVFSALQVREKLDGRISRAIEGIAGQGDWATDVSSQLISICTDEGGGISAHACHSFHHYRQSGVLRHPVNDLRDAYCFRSQVTGRDTPNHEPLFPAVRHNKP